MGMEFVRARKLALYRTYPDSFAESEAEEFESYIKTKIPKPLSASALEILGETEIFSHLAKLK
jgi:hypothetical protein